MTPRQQYDSLVESLRLVAAPYDEQVAAVPAFADLADEVATTFGDAYLLVPQLVRRGFVSEGAAGAIKRLDDWFCEMPRDGSVAGNNSLRYSPFWSAARVLACEALAALKEEMRPPDLRHIFYEEGSD